MEDVALFGKINALLKEGANEVMAYLTHGVLSGGAVSRIQNSSIKSLVLTDSIEPTEASNCARASTWSTATATRPRPRFRACRREGLFTMRLLRSGGVAPG